MRGGGSCSIGVGALAFGRITGGEGAAEVGDFAQERIRGGGPGAAVVSVMIWSAEFGALAATEFVGLFVEVLPRFGNRGLAGLALSLSLSGPGRCGIRETFGMLGLHDGRRKLSQLGIRLVQSGGGGVAIGGIVLKAAGIEKAEDAIGREGSVAKSGSPVDEKREDDEGVAGVLDDLENAFNDERVGGDIACTVDGVVDLLESLLDRVRSAGGDVFEDP